MDLDPKQDQQARHPFVPTTMNAPDRRRVKFTFLPPPTDLSDPLAIVELGRTAEVVLCLMPGDAHAEPVDANGHAMLSVLRALGFPSSVALVQTRSSLSTLNLKERSASKKRATEAFTRHVSSEHRVMAADVPSDFRQIIRHLTEASHAPALWRRQRPQLIAHAAEFIADENTSNKGRLVLTGYIRNRPLAAVQAVHVPTAGDFQIEVIEGLPEPTPANETGVSERHQQLGGAMDVDAKTSVVLARAEPDDREPLERENEIDLLDAEQTWPTEEEMVAAAEGAKRRRRLPKGTSEYQAAWILDDDDDEEEEGGYSDGEGVPALPGSNGVRSIPQVADGEEEDGAWVNDDGATEVDMEYDEDDEEEREEDAEAKVKARRAAERDELKYPDEIDLPAGTLARQRLARYRGLKSFRTSPWDPKEDLPQEYARVFAFENFKRALRRAQKSLDLPESGIAPVGAYVRVHLADVAIEAAQRVVDRVSASQTGQAPPLSAFGLLQHECKLSVANFSMRKATGYSNPIANKEELLFVTGLRTFMARPVLSTDEHGADKYKMERFLLEGRSTVATVYCPISYPPLPLLAFKVGDQGGPLRLAATGTLRDCTPDRVVLKKIVLSGYPVRAHKSKAVVRWMFHTPEDVRWFRPVELWSKHGRRGRIRESVGTHGAMKCIFDGPVGQQDTVCMSLYKRVYPKWPNDLDFAS